MNLLDQYYKGSQQQLDANREAATQKADIAYQKAQNYMPIINKQNGLSGLGVSESATLDMYNKHLNRQSGIDSAYDSASRDLFQNYLTDRQGILDKEYERAEAERLEKKQDQQTEYLYLENIINTGAFSDLESLGKQINEAYWSGKIGDQEYARLQYLFEDARTSTKFKDKLGNTHHDWEASRANTEEGRKPLTESLKSEGFEGWSAADLGGTYVGAFNNNAVVVAPDGQKMTIDELYEKLTTEEGMSEDEAEDIIVKLQKKLGIVDKERGDFERLSGYGGYLNEQHKPWFQFW